MHLSARPSRFTRPPRGALARRFAVAIVTVGAVALDAAGARPARAANKLACIDAHAEGQALRRGGRLLDARAKFLFCASGGCPPAIVGECSEFLKRLEAETPTVVVEAADPRGQAVLWTQVGIDDLPRQPIDGRPIPLDPGRHRFIVSSPDGRTAEAQVVLAAGDSLRHISLADPEAARVGVPARPVAPPLDPTSGAPTSSFVLGGVGFAGLAVWGGFGLAALSAQSCKGHCSRSDVSSIDRDYVVATGGLVVGLAALAGAALVYALRPAAHVANPGGGTQGRAPLVLGPAILHF